MSSRVAATLVAIALLAGCGGSAKPPSADATTVAGALQALRNAAAAHDAAAACRLLAPLSPGRPPGRALTELIKHEDATCDANFGKAREFDELARGLAGVKLAGVSTEGIVATASITGPHLPPGTTATFIRVDGLWRLAFATN